MIFFKTLLFLHIASGGLSFVIGLIVLCLKKGNKKHMQFGSVFYYLLLLASIISLPMAMMHTNYFLFIVGIFTIYMLLSGKRYLKIKSSINVKNTDRILTIIMFLFGLAFIIFGILKLFSNNNFGVVLLIFGIISFGFVTQDYKNFTKTNLPENIYLRSHISRMVGAYIASVTAFLVTNNHYVPSIIAWLLPTIVLVPLIVKWIRQFAPNK